MRKSFIKSASRFLRGNHAVKVPTKRKLVRIFIPSYPGPKVRTVEAAVTMSQTLPMFRPDYQCELQLAAGAYLPLMRNLAIREMLESDHLEGVLMVDHDAVWPNMLPGQNGKGDPGFNALDRLMSLEKDIVGGLFTTRTMPVQLMCGGFKPENGGLDWLDDVAKGHPLNGTPFQVDWMGCHFMYISRAAAEKTAKYVGSGLTLFDCNSRLMIDGRYREPLEGSLAQFKAGEIDLVEVKKQIELLVDHAGFFQEDISFCRRAKAAGCEIWVDPLFEIQHIGDYAYGRMDWIGHKMAQQEEAEAKAAAEEGKMGVPRLHGAATP